MSGKRECLGSNCRLVSEEKCATVVGAPLFPPEVRGRGERLGEAFFGPGRVEDFRPICLTFVHDARVFEFFDESLFPPRCTMSKQTWRK